MEGGVDLEEMEVAADLDGAVAGVRDAKGDSGEADVCFDGRGVGGDDFSGDHWKLKVGS